MDCSHTLMSSLEVPVTEAKPPVNSAFAKTKTRPVECKTGTIAISHDPPQIPSSASLASEQADFIQPEVLPWQNKGRFCNKLKGWILGRPKLEKKPGFTTTAFIDSTPDNQSSSSSKKGCPQVTAKHSTNPFGFDPQKHSPKTLSESTSSNDSSNIVLNYNFTPHLVHFPYTEFCHTEITSLADGPSHSSPNGLVDVEEIDLVGDQTGFDRSPHLAPDRDRSHGLPYPFQELVEQRNGMKMISSAPRSLLRIENVRHKIPSTRRMFLPPRILSSKIRSKFLVKTRGKQVHLCRLGSGRLVFKNLWELSELDLHDLRNPSAKRCRSVLSETF